MSQVFHLLLSLSYRGVRLPSGTIGLIHRPHQLTMNPIQNAQGWVLFEDQGKGLIEGIYVW